mmetsp:Transcript_2872/g.7475  ORF Transcript_2872/g.7475 Transcript_2872/m.7475 type:complete len:206 (-) Transcript_2872:690-1307(-)
MQEEVVSVPPRITDAASLAVAEGVPRLPGLCLGLLYTSQQLLPRGGERRLVSNAVPVATVATPWPRGATGSCGSACLHSRRCTSMPLLSLCPNSWHEGPGVLQHHRPHFLGLWPSASCVNASCVLHASAHWWEDAAKARTLRGQDKDVVLAVVLLDEAKFVLTPVHCTDPRIVLLQAGAILGMRSLGGAASCRPAPLWRRRLLPV